MSELNFTHSNGNKVKLTTPDTLAASKTFKLPGADGSSGEVLKTDGSGALSFASVIAHPNMVINGGMIISQRYYTNEFTPSPSPTNNRFTLDMMRYDMSQSSKFKVQQVTDSPAGFSHSMKVTSLSAYTSGTSDYFLLQNFIEGLNCARLGWGTSDAQTVTLSFYVKSSIEGVHACGIRNKDYNRSKTETYTINNANTWEYKTVTFTGDTSGSWNTDRNSGLKINFDIGSGSGFEAASTGTWLATNDFITSNSVKIVGTNGATWYITGLQLQVGDIATPFEHRDYEDEIRRCERYYQNSFSYGNIPGTSTDYADSVITTSWTDSNIPFANPFKVEMRVAPTVTLRPRGSTTTGRVNHGGSDVVASAQQIGTKNIAYIANTGGSSAGQFNAYTYELFADLD